MNLKFKSYKKYTDKNIKIKYFPLFNFLLESYLKNHSIYSLLIQTNKTKFRQSFSETILLKPNANYKIK